MSDPTIIRRYPGTKRFGEDSNWQTLFYGRDKDADDFFNEVLDRGVFSVLHGVTGSGKSSFIRAGLGAQLQSRRITPVYLDANKLLAANEVSLDQLLDSIFIKILARLGKGPLDSKLLADLQGYRTEAAELAKLGSNVARLTARTLFRKLLRGDLLNLQTEQSDSNRSFVIFLDQYDHMADKSKESQQMLLDVIHGFHDAADSEFASKLKLHSLVLIVRSEYLRLLVPLSSRVPGVFNHIYELHPLDAKRARECILGPARRDQNLFDGRRYLTSHWAYDKKLVDYIIDKATSKTGEGRVELLDLQRICSDIEEEQEVNFQRLLTLDHDLKKHIDEGRGRYLLKSISKAYRLSFGSRAGVRHTIRKNSLFYSELCDQQRRRSISEERFLSKFGNGPRARDFLQRLHGAESRILTRLDDGVNKPRLSYTHDLLAETAEKLRWRLPGKTFIYSSIIVVGLLVSGFVAQWWANTKYQELDQAQKSVQKFMQFSKQSIIQSKKLNNKLLKVRDFSYVADQALAVDEIKFGKIANNATGKKVEQEINEVINVLEYQQLFASHLVGADVEVEQVDGVRCDQIEDNACKEYIQTTKAERRNPSESLASEIRRKNYSINALSNIEEDDTVTVIADRLYMSGINQKALGSSGNYKLGRKSLYEYRVEEDIATGSKKVTSRPVEFASYSRGDLEPNSVSNYKDYLVVGTNNGEILFCKVVDSKCNPDVVFRHGDSDILQLQIIRSQASGRWFLITMDDEGEIRANLILQTFDDSFVRVKTIFTIATPYVNDAQLYFTTQRNLGPVFKVVEDGNSKVIENDNVLHVLPYKRPNEFFNGAPEALENRSNASYYSSAVSKNGKSIYYGRSAGLTNAGEIEPLSLHWWRDREGARISQKPVYKLPVADSGPIERAGGLNPEQPWRMLTFIEGDDEYLATVTTFGRLILCQVINGLGDELRCDHKVLDNADNPALAGRELHDLQWDEAQRSLLIASFSGQLIQVAFSTNSTPLNLADTVVNQSVVRCDNVTQESDIPLRKLTSVSISPDGQHIAMALRALNLDERADVMRSRSWQSEDRKNQWSDSVGKNCLVTGAKSDFYAKLEKGAEILPSKTGSGRSAFNSRFMNDKSAKSISWLDDNRMAYSGFEKLQVLCTEGNTTCTDYNFNLEGMGLRNYWKVQTLGDFVLALHSYGLDIWHVPTGELAVNYTYPIEDAAVVKSFNRTLDFGIHCGEETCDIGVPIRRLGILAVNIPRPIAQ